jgi:hypothetical protein
MLSLIEAAAGGAAFATPDEVELIERSLIAPRGTADAERLGVRPRAMAEVLGLV